MLNADAIGVATPTRRALLAGASAFFSLANLPAPASAAGARDPRLVVIVLRGALDGLSAVAPVGDPDYLSLHGKISLAPDGPSPALRLDPSFALHPAMGNFHRLFAAKQAAVVHAVATPYRDRSHFDGQDVLESGHPVPGFKASGWLNRAISAVAASEPVRRRGGLSVGPATPLILRGPAPVVGWAPESLNHAGDDLTQRLLDLYRHTDAPLESALVRGVGIEKVAEREMGRPQAARFGMDTTPGMMRAAAGAAKLLAADDGPRVATLVFTGWDTHANEGGQSGRLAQLLSGFDKAIGELEKGLGARWRDTVVVAVTEFGRTARINGTSGTDHGTATCAFLVGGAVAGGRVIADWPGLKEQQLYQQRDLRPTTDLRAMLKGVLADHLHVGQDALTNAVFPDSAAARAMKGLIA